MHRCVRELIESDMSGRSQDISYTDQDVIAATLLYTHVMNNRMIHKLVEEKVSLGYSRQVSSNYSTMINNLTKMMSDVDTKNYRKKIEPKKKK